MSSASARACWRRGARGANPATTTRYPRGPMFQGMLGNSREIDTAALRQDLNALLVEGEEMQRAFKILRDLSCFTNRDQPLLG